MQQPDPLRTDESINVVHLARSMTEAMVIRRLLEGAGISSPELSGGSLLWPGAFSVVEFIREIEIPIYAIASQAGRARQLIAEYLAEEERDGDNPEDPDVGSDDDV